MPRQIKTIGSNYAQESVLPITSRDYYVCANSSITRGVTSTPISLDECFTKFPSVQNIAYKLGFLGTGPNGFVYSLITGATAPQTNLTNSSTAYVDLLLDNPSGECSRVQSSSFFGNDWLGCLWGTPNAPFSCVCPEIRPKFEAYLKLRLNVATFWSTPKNTPCNRAEFLDAFKYGKKATITVAGDFNLKLGQVINLVVNAASGYPYYDSESELNGLYYIIGIKHVVTNSGTHETALSLSQIAPYQTASEAGSTFAADYP